MTDTSRRRLLWLIAARAVAITLLLGTAILIEVRAPGRYPVRPLFLLIAVTYGLTALYSVMLDVAPRRPWIVDAQLAMDALIAGAFVLMTGGVASYFSSLFTLPIIAASTLRARRGGLLVGGFSAMLFGAIVVVQYYGPADLPDGISPELLPPMRLALFTLGTNAFGFLALGALSGHLAEGWRETGEKLEHMTIQLADLQAFSQHIIDSLTSGLVTTDMDGRILTFNRAAVAITGIPESEAVGAAAAEVLQLPPDCASMFALHDRVLPRVEFPFIRPDTTRIEMGLSTALLITPRGETGFVFTFQDVTESRRREREARVQQRLAAVGEMAAGIAHEIRNPLASMSGSIQILRQELPLTEDQSQLMDIVLRESERLNETIRSFLAYARPQRQGSGAMDVRQVLSDTARLLRNDSRVTERHQIEVDAQDAIAFDGDESQIRQIVWNLATNGIRAMPDGGRLRLAAARETRDGATRQEMVLTVQDEGVGIPAEELDGIFQPFRSSFARGTGLGLSIVQRIVSEYDGEIQVTSDRGHGTSVMVRLPLKSIEPADQYAMAKGQ